MPTISDVIKAVRIRIGDYDLNEQRYGDDFIIELIGMAISSPPLSSVLSDLFIDPNSLEFNRNVNNTEKNLIAIKSHLHYLYSLKTSTDRDNISITKGRLRIDNTQQSRDVENSIKLVDEEFKKAFYYAFGVKGVRVE